jgi:competence protein ComEA
MCISIILYVFSCNKINEPQYEYALAPKQTHKKPQNAEVHNDTIIDINSAQYHDFIAIGLPAYIAQRIMNYKEKGGRFYEKEDIKKIYGLRNIMYEKIEHNIYVGLTSKTKTKRIAGEKKSEKSKPQKAVSPLFNINTCSKEELVKVYMIGDFRAQKIIEYRDKLGGFFSFDQILEVYSIDSLVLQQLQKATYIDTNTIARININTCTFKELLNHPYCSYNMTKDIFSYKKIQGNIDAITELRDNNILEHAEFVKIQRYLKTF